MHFYQTFCSIDGSHGINIKKKTNNYLKLLMIYIFIPD